MADGTPTPLHMVDLIRRKRDGGTLDAREIGFLAAGAASGSIRGEQLAAWLMAAWLRGLSLEETRALTLAMRDSGEKFSPAGLGKKAVDKHSTGGVGDKTSFLVAPIAAACGVAVPMISGRALGHTGGTLDKLESIPGFRTALTLKEFEAVLRECGASIVSQTPRLVPADRVLYELRDRTATVESPGLICASILSKKLAAGLDALVLDVKTGSGAFLRKQEDSEYLAALMVATAEGAGTRTVALLTDMSQPLGSAAGNWIELMEAVELLRGKRPARERGSARAFADIGRMDDSPGRRGGVRRRTGYQRAEAALADGSALKHFFAMIEGAGRRRFGVRRCSWISRAGRDRGGAGVGARICGGDGYDGAGLGGAADGSRTRESRRACRSARGDRVPCAARRFRREGAADGDCLCDQTRECCESRWRF